MSNMSVGIKSDIGSRKVQQDATVAFRDEEKDITVALLCDGMGGMQGGEQASFLCVNMIYNDFYENEKVNNYHQFLIDEIDKADIEVSCLTDSQGNKIHAGTTFVAVIVRENKLFWGSVGDSRLYIIRDGKILQITEDHNYLMQLKEKVKTGEISMEEALNNKEKESLISYIGIKGIKYIDSNINPFELINGDCLILCSDGVYRSLNDENIKEIIMACEDDMDAGAKCLVEEAIGMGNPHQDNTTVIAIKYL